MDHFPLDRSIHDDSDVKAYLQLNNRTMEDWTQAGHPVFGAKLSRLPTIFARADKNKIEVGRKSEATYLLLTMNYFHPSLQFDAV